MSRFFWNASGSKPPHSDVIPAGNGIMHQINLEKMSPVVQAKEGVAYPDTCVGTDSHTPHVDALGVISVGVGGLEAETVMLGHPSMMRLPDIVGVELSGKRQPGITATDIVLALTEFLRKERVVGAYVEFYGEGASSLSIGDRATISNMTPEYGATAAMVQPALAHDRSVSGIQWSAHQWRTWPPWHRMTSYWL